MDNPPVHQSQLSISTQAVTGDQQIQTNQLRSASTPPHLSGI